MTEASKATREFFDAYAKATVSLDLAFPWTAYGDTFMFAGPGGVQAVKRDDFLKVIPKRGAFFRAAGLVASEVRRLEEMRLDDKHTMVQAQWELRFEKEPGRPIIDESAATYVLRRQEDSQHDGQPQRPLRPHDAFDLPNGLTEHALVEEEQRSECLILRRRADMLGRREPPQNRRNVRRAQCGRVRLLMEAESGESRSHRRLRCVG
jgi:hypothetical protein